jgi:hypothetical protein
MSKVPTDTIRAIDKRVVELLRKSSDLGKLGAKADKTKDPNDYHKWSQAYDALERDFLVLVAKADGITTPEELGQVAGGTYYGENPMEDGR